MSQELSEEKGCTSQAQKKYKEKQARIEELEETLEIEKKQKGQIIKQRDELRSELNDLEAKLEEAGGVTQAQIELNKRQEAEMAKLRRDMEDANLAHEVIKFRDFL